MFTSQFPTGIRKNNNHEPRNIPSQRSSELFASISDDDRAAFFKLQGKVLDELDVIECFEVPGDAIQSGEITKKQIDLYRKMGAEQPPSLQ
ncbi:MAG: hypothetical protein CSA18_00355 [Deltaproteobacteria bacterium]|nr:MAG: hypothetical protein CSA18_00355 [Deltaproteobacteria bacterium]